MLQRSLYALEMAWHPSCALSRMLFLQSCGQHPSGQSQETGTTIVVLLLRRFSPASTNCRLPYDIEENRPLFTALFRYMQVLIMVTHMHPA